jgi:hypothetical protein
VQRTIMFQGALRHENHILGHIVWKGALPSDFCLFAQHFSLSVMATIEFHAPTA